MKESQSKSAAEKKLEQQIKKREYMTGALKRTNISSSDADFDYKYEAT